MVANLGLAENAPWRLGDFNGDGAVDVSGDAFALIANLGRTLIPAGSSLSTSTFLTSAEFPPTEPAAISAASPVLIDSIFEDDDDAEQDLIASRDNVFADKAQALLLS